MSPYHGEARSLTRGALLLLVLSIVRYANDVIPRSAIVPERGMESSVALDSLTAHTLAALEDEERRSRPIRGGEVMDPNRADLIDLDRLPGIGPSTAEAIVEAREGGAIFTGPSDLLAVRGIGPVTVERIAPYLEFKHGFGRRSIPMRSANSGAGRMTKLGRSALLDVNSADVERLVTLPGIGPALAARIVAERDRRPFASLDDLTRVRGIGGTTVDRIRGLATARRRR